MRIEPFGLNCRHILHEGPEIQSIGVIADDFLTYLSSLASFCFSDFRLARFMITVEGNARVARVVVSDEMVQIVAISFVEKAKVGLR